MVDRTRLQCASLGHKWSDGYYVKEKASPKLGIRHIWVLRLQCERDGCGRQRQDHVEPKTFKLISRRYFGEYEKMERMTRDQIRAALIRLEGK